jgi:hypothetical protein
VLEHFHAGHDVEPARVGDRQRFRRRDPVVDLQAFGRGVLRGVSRWLREHEPWRLYADERGFEEGVPAGLETWQVDGVISTATFHWITDHARLFAGLHAVLRPGARVILIDNNHAQHIRIKYNTNGTRLPTEQLLFWSKFKAVELNISVDGIGKQFEYLRFPAKWDELNSNVRFYQNLRNNVPNLELTIITTVSILNIGYIEEILDYCQSHDLKLFLNMLDRPAVLNLYNFDVNVKSWILSRIHHIDHPVIKNIVEIFHHIVWNESPPRWIYIYIVISTIFGVIMGHLCPLELLW